MDYRLIIQIVPHKQNIIILPVSNIRSAFLIIIYEHEFQVCKSIYVYRVGDMRTCFDQGSNPFFQIAIKLSSINRYVITLLPVFKLMCNLIL